MADLYVFVLFTNEAYGWTDQQTDKPMIAIVQCGTCKIMTINPLMDGYSLSSSMTYHLATFTKIRRSEFFY